MFKPDLRADLTATGAIFTIIVCSFIWVSANFQFAKQLEQLHSGLFTAKSLVVELYTENVQLHSSVVYLNQAYIDSQAEAKYYRKLSNLKEDLRQFTIEDQASGLALGWTESNWDYKAKHNSSARGICGVMPLWDPYLAELKINPNSIEACIAIYNFYLDQTASKTQAIKKYKGIESKHNLWIVKRTLEVRTYILHKLKED